MTAAWSCVPYDWRTECLRLRAAIHRTLNRCEHSDGAFFVLEIAEADALEAALAKAGGGT